MKWFLAINTEARNEAAGGDMEISAKQGNRLWHRKDSCIAAINSTMKEKLIVQMAQRIRLKILSFRRKLPGL